MLMRKAEVQVLLLLTYGNYCLEMAFRRRWVRTHRWQVSSGVAAHTTWYTKAIIRIIPSVEVCSGMVPLVAQFDI